MGSWSVNCNISNITITAGHKCVFLPLKNNEHYDAYLPYIPATMPIFGEYDDYGGIEKIEIDENTKLIEEYFGCTIDEFCYFFTRGLVDKSDNEILKKLRKNKEIKKWKFMYIDREVYDIMSNHNGTKYGDHEYGNPELLKMLGAEYIGIDKSIDRYNQVWKLNGVDFNCDGRWLQTNGKPIYNYDPSLLLNALSEDKKEILKMHKYKLWDIFSDEYLSSRFFWIIGIDGSGYRLNKLLAKLDDETFEKLYPGQKKKMEAPSTLAETYTNNFKTYGKYFSDLMIIRSNMHCFSQYFNPQLPYLTPQCGEFKEHQFLLEKFSEINKSRIYDEDDD